MPKPSSENSKAREEQITRRKNRAEWTADNLPPLEYLSLSFSAFLCVSIYLNSINYSDTYTICRCMAMGAAFYFISDSLLEILVLDRWSFIPHHVIACIVFYMVYYAEHYQYSIPLIDTYLPILGWFEVSTIMLNFRSLIKEYAFKIRKKSNSIAAATFSEGSIGEPDTVPLKEETREMQLSTELFFIFVYGGIRLVQIPLMLYERVAVTDPMAWMACVLIAMSAKWVWEWIASTKKRYFDPKPAKVAKKE